MKNYLILIVLCLFASLANAQERMSKEDMFPKNAKYFIKGGAEIPYVKIDSVIQSWGGKLQIEKRDDGNEKKVYLVKVDEASMMKEQQNRAQQTSQMIGKVAPPIELADINGKKYSLQDLKGKVVVLNFWFVACVPCKEEMPELNKLVEKYKGKDVVFLAIANDNTEQAKEFLKTNPFNYNILTSGRKTAEAYSVAAYPTSMVINKSGVISYSQLSGMNIVEALTREIDKQL